MATNDYQFITQWRVLGTCEEVYDILVKPADFPRWWPAVYLEVKVGEGETEFYTKGWLPYTLRWKSRHLEAVRPHKLTLEAWGDLVGRGIWELQQDGDYVNLTYNWKVRASKSLLRHLSFLIKPLFEMNHRWAMDKGEESLKLELARRHARNATELAQIPNPPPPTTKSVVPLLVGTAGTVGGTAGLAYLLTRNNDKNKK